MKHKNSHVAKIRKYFFNIAFLGFTTLTIQGCGSDKQENIETFNTKLAQYYDIDFSVANNEEEAFVVLQNSISPSFNMYAHYNIGDPIPLAERYLKTGYPSNRHGDLALNAPLPWGTIFDTDKSYTFQLNAMYPAYPFIFAYEESGDQKYFDFAKMLYLDWAEQNIDQDIDNYFKWYDMSTGIRTMHLSWFLRQLIKQDAPLEEVQYFSEILKIHLDHLTNPEELGNGNHGLFQMTGILAICNALPKFKGCPEAIEYSKVNFEIFARSQYFDDGAHTEHSPTYQMYVLSKLEQLFSTGWFEDGYLDSMISKAKSVIPWFYHPNREIALLGDTVQMDMYRYEEWHPHVKYVFTDGKQGVAPENGPKWFKDTGYAVIRSDWDELPLSEHSYLIMAGGYHSSFHKHADDLTFSWSEFGQQLIVDSGYYAGDRSDMRKFMQSTRAHNTILIDNSNYPTDVDSAYGSAIKNVSQNVENDLANIKAVVEHKKFNTTHRRDLYLQPKKWLLVSDNLTATSSHVYSQMFHLHPELELINSAEGRYSTFRLPNQDKYLHIIKIDDESVVTSLIKGQTEPKYQGWYSSREHQVQENYVYSFARKRQDTHFLTLLVLTDTSNFNITGLEYSFKDNELIEACWFDHDINKTTGVKVKEGIVTNCD